MTLRHLMTRAPGMLAAVAFIGLTAGTPSRVEAAGPPATTFVYYDFNNATSTATLETPSIGTSTMTSDFTGTNIGSVTGTTVNQNGSTIAGTALQLKGVNGAVNKLTFTADASLYDKIIVSYATTGTATGFTSQQFQYSTTGAAGTFTNLGTAITPPGAFATQTFDLSSITALNHNANAAFRIIFSGGASLAGTGNNKIDNLKITGVVPELSTSVAMMFGVLGLGVLMVAKRRKSLRL